MKLLYILNEDRYNIKLDIYLNLIGSELPKMKCAICIDDSCEYDILYLEN